MLCVMLLLCYVVDMFCCKTVCYVMLMSVGQYFTLDILLANRV